MMVNLLFKSEVDGYKIPKIKDSNYDKFIKLMTQLLKELRNWGPGTCGLNIIEIRNTMTFMLGISIWIEI